MLSLFCVAGMDVKKMNAAEQRAACDQTSLITAQKYNSISLFSDLGQTGSCFMKKIFAGCPSGRRTSLDNKRADNQQLYNEHLRTRTVRGLREPWSPRLEFLTDRYL